MPVNFRQLDLNLLRVLCAVYRQGSVTAAARQLSLSQPAASNALARLRRHFDDELFVRSPDGLHPTRLSQRVTPEVIAHLQGLEAILASAEHFEPSQARVQWRLSLSDLGEMLFLAPLVQVLRAESPGSRIANVAVPAERVSAALEAREIDLAIGILSPQHASISSVTLFRERFVGIADRRWRPGVGRPGARLDTTQLSQVSLAVAAPTATFHGTVEKMLERLKLDGRTVVHARHYGALPDMVIGTDLLAIVPRMFADSLAPRFDLRVWELPGRDAGYDVRMVWHRSTTRDSAHEWLRAHARRLFARGAAAQTPR